MQLYGAWDWEFIGCVIITMAGGEYFFPNLYNFYPLRAVFFFLTSIGIPALTQF
jgi:hypothetical protein